MEKRKLEYEYIAQNICFTMMLDAPQKESRPTVRVSDSFHKHAWYEFFYVESGEHFLHFEDERICLHAGDFMLVSPETLHHAGESAEGYRVCSFSVSTLKNGAAEESLFPFLSNYPYRTFRADDLCALLMRRLTTSLENGNGVAAGSSLAALLFRAAEICAAAAPRKASASDSSIGRIYKIEQALYGYYTDELPLSDLAEELHLSERQISRIFKKQYGVSYRAKNRELRMQAAARRLLRGEEVAEVAAGVGYASQSAFYAAFKAYYGVSPSVYKSERKNK